jgi:uncharacterized iron-regulated membrane protein
VTADFVLSAFGSALASWQQLFLVFGCFILIVLLFVGFVGFWPRPPNFV